MKYQYWYYSLICFIWLLPLQSMQNWSWRELPKYLGHIGQQTRQLGTRHIGKLKELIQATPRIIPTWIKKHPRIAGGTVITFGAIAGGALLYRNYLERQRKRKEMENNLLRGCFVKNDLIEA